MTSSIPPCAMVVHADMLTGVDWFKSSYSAGEGDCVEVADLRQSLLATGVPWSKSSYSGGEGDCVEVADLRSTSFRSVAVRDSKDPEGPAFLVAPDQFAAFTAFAAGFEV